MRFQHLFLWVACAVAVAGLHSSANATTFVLMDEHELAAASTAVISGWVTGVESHPDGLTGGVNTYVTIEPTAVIAGALPEGEIVLREPGGQVQGHNEKIFGAPEYSVGEEVMAFLSQDADGSLHTTNMAMGKYTVQTLSGAPIVSRSLGAEVMVLDRTTGRLHAHAAPDVVQLRQFVEHVRSAARRPRHPGPRQLAVQLTPPELGVTVPHSYQSPFTYLGNPSRWFEPDFGQPVLYQIDASGDARNGPAASRDAVNSAFAAWTNVPGASLILGDGGLLSTAMPFTGCDGGSRIVFNDPFNEISDPSGCGGILAIGGYCSNAETKTVNGTTFQRITLGKVVFNNGWEQCDLWNACNLAEVATHEIGHTIGLGHSNDATATMAAAAHFDGRCAGLQIDDITAAQFVYPEGMDAPTPTAPPAPQPTTTSTPAPPAPTLSPTPASGLPNDACANATTIDSGSYSNTVVTTGATIDARDPAPSCGNGSRGKSVWYRFTAPSNGTLTVNTFGSSYDTILAAYVGSCGSFAPVAGGCNDDASIRQSRVSFQATAATTYYFMAVAYSNDGGSLTVQATFQGSAGGSATPTRTSTLRPATPTSAPRAATPTNTAAQSPTATLTPVSTIAAGNTPPPTAPPSSSCPNDSCMTPMDVGATPFSYSMLTTTATLDPTDPAPACGNRSRAKSVWFRFTAPSDGTLTADTFGSNYDTILAAFVKPDDTLNPVSGGCNDDSSGAQSRVAFSASAGSTYYFLVTAYSGNGGNLLFHLSFQGTGGAQPPTATPSATQPPAFAATPTMTPAMQASPPPSNTGLANDVCTGATDVSGTPFSSRLATSSALTEASVPGPACGNQSRSKSVWYRFTAPTNGTVGVNTYGSTYDTILAAYTGSCPALTQVACNDDSVGAQSRIAFQAAAGTTYYFQVTAYRNDGGVLVFQLTN